MIVSASRRTDVPAFYSDWFLNRVKAGFALVRNPFNPEQVRRVELTPESVQAVVFWTRDPRPFMPRLDELDDLGFRTAFLFTITGLPRSLEPFGPDWKEAADAFRRLADRIGPDRVVWRFDPIVVSNLTDEAWQTARFDQIAERLESATRRVIISFVDMYRKVRKNLDRVERERGIVVDDVHLDPERLRSLAGRLAAVAGRAGLSLQTCCEAADPSDLGVAGGACIDAAWLNRVFGLNLEPGRDRSQRNLCRCAPSVDVGAYDACLHGCVYCYATRDRRTALANRARHDPEGPSLLP